MTSVGYAGKLPLKQVPYAYRLARCKRTLQERAATEDGQRDIPLFVTFYDAAAASLTPIYLHIMSCILFYKAAWTLFQIRIPSVPLRFAPMLLLIPS